MRGVTRWISCDYGGRDEADPRFMGCEEVYEALPGTGWPELISDASEEGWSCKRGKHLCPEHNNQEPF